MVIRTHGEVGRRVGSAAEAQRECEWHVQAGGENLEEEWCAQQRGTREGGCAPSHVVVVVTGGRCAASAAASVHQTAVRRAASVSRPSRMRRLVAPQNK